MFKWFSNILADTKPQGRTTLRIALVILGVTIVNAPIFSYLYTQYPSRQLSAIVSGNIALILAIALSAVLAWANRYQRAVDVIVFGIGIFAALIVALITNLGIIFSISFFIFAILIAGEALSNKEALRVILIGLRISIIIVVGDLFIPWQRLSLPVLQSTLTYIIVIVLLIQSLRIVRLFPSYSLRTKLIALLVGVSFISISLVAFVANRVVSNQLNKTLGENLTTLSKNNATQVGSILEQNYERINIFILNKAIQDSVDIANGKGTADLTELSALNTRWKNSSDTNQFVRSTQNNEMAAALRELTIYYPDIEKAIITDKNGAVIAATDRTTDYYQGDKIWWQSAWNNSRGGFYISQPTVEKVTETNASEANTINAINIAMPISGHNRIDVIGVIQATISINRMNSILTNNQFGETGRATLIFQPIEKYIEGDTGLIIIPSEILSNINSISNTSNIIFFEDAPSLAASAPVQSGNPRISYAVSAANWIVLVHQDLSEVQAPLVTTTRTITLIALALLLAVGFLAFYVGNQFTRPIEDLTSTAALLAEGDLYARAKTESQDEIGILAKTLNSMSSQVLELVNTLEQRVTYRTKALETSTKVGHNISTILDEKKLIVEVVEQVKNSFDYYHTQIYLIDEKTGELVMSYGSGEAGQALLARGHKLAKGVGLVGRAAETNTAIWVSNTINHPVWKSNPLIPDTKSEIALPISIGDTVLGVLDVQQDIADSLQQGDVDVLQSISNQVAIGLQNARSYAATQQRAEREALITSIGQKILNETTVESALQVAVREVGRVLGTQTSVRLGSASKNNETNPVRSPQIK